MFSDPSPAAARPSGASRGHRPASALLAIAVLWWPNAASAEPLVVTNQTPLTRLIGIPAAQPVRPGDGASWSLVADWSSHATVSSSGAEAIALDGESLVVTARADVFRGPWRFTLAVPFVHQYGGVLDSWIDEYHQLLGFPEGDRPVLGQDELLYRYRREGRLLLDRNRGSKGLGDARLGAQRSLVDRHDFALAVHVQLKLPSGASDDLLGSGGVDLALGAAAEWPVPLLGREATLYGGAGVLFSERGDVLPDLRKRVLGYSHMGMAWPWTATLSINAQLDAHTSPYDSRLTELSNALQLSVGFAWAFAPEWALTFAVNEDIAVHSSPDVTFQFGVRRITSPATRPALAADYQPVQKRPAHP